MQQKWQYFWRLQPPLAAWTLAEERAFHGRADQEIWAAWSNRARVRVSGKSDFAKRFTGLELPLNLDIRRVLANPHWTVSVTKIPVSEFKTSSVVWRTRTITLDTNDFVTRTICRGVPKHCTQQVPVAHEFGHAAGNTSVLARGDEYRASSPHAADQGSILHSGNQLRTRHFQTILDEMNQAIPDTLFTVSRV